MIDDPDEIVEFDLPVIDHIGIGESSKSAGISTDIFTKPADELRKFNNLSPNFKRRSAYQVQKFLAGDNAESKQIENSIITGYDIFQAAVPPHNVDYLSSLYEISSYHAAAVDAKTANVVGLGYDFKESPKLKEKIQAIEDETKLDKTSKKVERMRIAMVDWLASLNNDSLFTETLMKVYIDWQVTGNGYLEIGRKTTGEIGYVGHIPASAMRVRIPRDGFIQIIGRDVVFFRNFGEQTADPIGNDPNPNEVIHFKRYSPKNTYYGVPSIMSASSAVAGNEFTARYNLDFFENKAVPRYLMTLKGAKLTREAERRLMEFFEVGLKGKNHRSIYIPLPSDDPNNKVEFKMEPIEAGVQESSFMKYKESNRDEILFVHRTPISKIGIAEGISLAMAKDADRTFKEQVAGPDQKIINEYINKLIKEKTDALVFKLNELTFTDEDAQSQIDERYLRMQTVMPNEIRARMGLPPIDDGDQPVQIGAQANAEQRAQAGQTRTRDQQRSSMASDSGTRPRNPQGEGRQSP
jgi:PBSX family phage portal protein